MECAGCNFKNREGTKSCKECGSKIEIGCPQCGHLNPPGSKFCLECGHDLRTPPAAALPKELPFDKKLAKIQKCLPSRLTEKILVQRDRIGVRPCNQMMFHLGRNHVFCSELFRQKGDTLKAKEQLGKAIGIHKECGADGWVKKAEEELAKLS